VTNQETIDALAFHLLRALDENDRLKAIIEEGGRVATDTPFYADYHDLPVYVECGDCGTTLDRETSECMTCAEAEFFAELYEREGAL
jgi:hypothetical protein